MNHDAILNPTESKEKTLTPSEKFLRDLFHVLRKIKAEWLYHVDYELSSLFQNDRFPDHRFPIFPYRFDSGYNSSTCERIYDDGLWLRYNIELIALLKWAHLGCIVQFGLEGKCYDYHEFTRMKELKFPSIWIRINMEIFNALYAEFEKKESLDIAIKEEPALTGPAAKNEKIIPFKATPEYSLVTVCD